MQKILITGGTGTLGNHIVDSLHNLAVIRIYSRDEYKQKQMREKYPNCKYLIGDVRDKERLDMAMEDIDIVIHAAALKQIDTGEYNPFEFIKTNINGTQNVIECALRNNVKQVLLISSDKAVNPVNLYGFTKGCAERLIVAANNYRGKHKTEFKFVRYGNVFASRGSVLEAWNHNFEVRDRDATRYHLSVDQALDIIKNALESNYIINIPANLYSYNLGDLADVYSELTGKKPIYTQLLPGEKKHETLDGLTNSYNARRIPKDVLRCLVSDYLNLTLVKKKKMLL